MGSRLWRGSRILSLSKLYCIGHLEELPHQRVDGHFIGDPTGLSKSLDASVLLIRQLKGDELLARLRMLGNKITSVWAAVAVRKPLKTHGKGFGQLRCHFSTRLASTLLVPRNLRSSNATDLGQVSLRPAMAGARLDEALWKFAVHFFQN